MKMPIEGKRIILREHRKEDSPNRTKLRNNLETQGVAQSLPLDYTTEMHEKAHDKRELSTLTRSEGLFVIEEKETKKFVGSISYSELNPRFSAVNGISLLKEFWGRGYGYEAHELLLEFLFHEVGLRVSYWATWSQNIGSIKLAEKSGYSIVIRSRDAVFKGGKLYDFLILELLREEYYEKHPELKDELPGL